MLAACPVPRDGGRVQLQVPVAGLGEAAVAVVDVFNESWLPGCELTSSGSMLRLLPRSMPSRCWSHAARTFGTAPAAAAAAPAGVSRHRAIAMTRAAAAQLQAAQSSVVQAPPREAWLERSLEDDQCVAITR